ncbi:MAG: Crp/Fnr family transcriptional regulator [Magnetospirillum sp.]|nr:Crp/Fnr family transcriptional regulator [Magnetospirillum sp.]
MSDIVRERGLDAGQALFRQGDATFGIFAVVSGRLGLVRHTSEGREVAVHVASAGDTFAEAALFSDVYHCDAVAAVSSRIAVLPKDAVLRAFAADPAAALGFTARLARQVQTLRSRLEIRNLRSASERVHQFLLLAAKAGTVDFDRPLKEVAAEVGLSHEAFYRALAALARQGHIIRRSRVIELRSPPPAR